MLAVDLVGLVAGVIPVSAGLAAWLVKTIFLDPVKELRKEIRELRGDLEELSGHLERTTHAAIRFGLRLEALEDRILPWDGRERRGQHRRAEDDL